MKTEKNILTAFILNLTFSVFECIGGIFSGSISIISDAIHDFGDAATIGISYFLEKKSKKQPDEKYTYGYARFSVIGAVITTFILILGSVSVICNAVKRLIYPAEINYNGMTVLAIVGVCVNLSAAYFTRDGDSLNQKSVNLHMLEDVLGWAVVLVGATVMKITDWAFIDPLISVGVSIFILINAVKNLKEATDLFLEKTPHGIDIKDLTAHISEIDGVLGVHHIHIRSVDGQKNCATMHIVTNSDYLRIKEAVREELREHGINHATLELEREDEHCHEEHCSIEYTVSPIHNHH